MRDIGIVSGLACYMHENIDSAYVFEFLVTIISREVRMRMLLSLTERRNILREPK